MSVIDGHTLGLVDGHGVAVLKVARGQVTEVKLNVHGAPDDAKGQAGRLVVDGGDRAHGAVVDTDRDPLPPGATVVSSAQDPVTHLERGLTDHEGRSGETTLVRHPLSCEPVQRSYLSASAGEQDAVGGGEAVAPPVIDSLSVEVGRQLGMAAIKQDPSSGYRRQDQRDLGYF
jgi:hypothetical protein